MLQQTTGYQLITDWMAKKNQAPFDFQEQTWQTYAEGYSGLVVAPTGFGKTFSVFLAVVVDYLNHPHQYQKGLKLIWVSPLRSLAKDLAKAMNQALLEIGLDWIAAVRNGDTPINEKRKQERLMPDVLITTPETLHLLFAQKKHSKWFANVQCIAVDEWHELLGSKRGVLTELAIAQIKSYQPKLKVWGITATIGNLEEAKEVLIPSSKMKSIIIKSEFQKKLEVISVLPDEVEELSWAGHLGKKMSSKIIPILQQHKSTLVFTNTRNQSELWYQILLEEEPDLAGQIAIHHGSIDKVQRNFIEEALANGYLKAVICTSSLDLGVDFKPVDCVIQIGSSKGIARFVQRAGRSGHSPFETSKIYFVPTHSLQLIEIAAVKEAIKNQEIETRQPLVQPFDVLVQFLVTLAVGEGFDKANIFQIIKKTFAYQYITDDEFNWCLHFITKGGNTLNAYNEFHKVVIENDVYKVISRRIAMLHRMNIGVIVSESMMLVKYQKGGYIGMVEEYFISKLNKGDAFTLSGKVLEIIHIKEMTVSVKNSTKKKAITPSWLGGRLPLTSYLSHFLRYKLSDALYANQQEIELQFLHPLLKNQATNSHIPKKDELLIELIKTKDGYHLFMYPFEGRLVNEIMAALVAYRLAQIQPLTFTIATNDYGFELLSDQIIPLTDANVHQILSKKNLIADVTASINASEMASRKFRDIAQIAGLVVQSQPGNQKNNKSLQSSSSLIFRVFEQYEPQNLLLKQAYTEVFDDELEAARLQEAFERISKSTIIIKKANGFTPLSFPLKVDSLRGVLTNEELSKRIERIQKQALAWE